jgi:peptidoglycan/xylan/chitin deacetylase (PgdA/CDA1 family)
MMPETNPIKFEKGIFTLSLDFELIWGTADLGLEDFKRICKTERQVVIDRLLALFEEFEFSATWAILGHLFLDKCESKNGKKHPEIIRPNFSWIKNDWFAHDPGGIETGESIHLGRTLVEKIRNCRIPQEIASHSFSHIVFGDEGCSRETAESEIAECVRIADEQGIELKSFVFPRNEIGHLEILKKFDFACYRGVEPNWYENRKIPEGIRRGLRLFDVLRAATPPAVLPQLTNEGLWNIPGSAMFFPMHGFRRKIPMNLRVKRCLKGLDKAAQTKKIFHLWFHPTNMVDELETMFAGLREILQYASNLKKEGCLDFLTMREISNLVAK